MKRLLVRSPQSGTVRTLLRVDRTTRLNDAVPHADVVQQEVAVRVDDLVAERRRDDVDLRFCVSAKTLTLRTVPQAPS